MNPAALIFLIPIVWIISQTILKLSQSRSTHAIGQSQAGSDADRRIDLLEEEMRQLREDLAETQERVDFSERLLSQVSQARRDTAT